MPFTSITYWLLGIAVLAINLAAVYVAWRALFSDRSRGRRRCPRCWHNLDYTPGMTCGECGHTAPKESHFYRTHRRFGRAAIAILVCAALAAFIFDRANHRGWASMMPTNLLILCMPIANDGPGSMLSELDRRIASDTLTDGELSSFINRCAEGDWIAPPGSATWDDKYAQRLDRLRMQLARLRLNEHTITQSEAQLLDLHPVITATSRQHWPGDMTPRINLRVNDFWPLGTGCRVTVTPITTPPVDADAPSARSHTFHRNDSFAFNDSFDIELDGVVADASSREVRVDVARRTPGSGVLEHVYTTTLPVHVEAGPPLHELIKPRTSPDMDLAMTSVFAGDAHVWPSGPSPVRFSYDWSRTAIEAFDDTAVGVRVQLRKNGELARELHLWWLAGTLDNTSTNSSSARARGGTAPPRRNSGFEVAFENAELLRTLAAPAAESQQTWTMTVTSDPALALRAGDATAYWSGSVEIPLQFSQRQGAAPVIGWWSEDRLRETGVAPEEQR